MSDPANQAAVAIKKKSKKRKKNKKAENGTAEGSSEHTEKAPKQISDKDEQVITTARCQRCKGTFRQIVQSGEAATAAQLANWMCPSCVQAVRAEEEKVAAAYGAVPRSSKEVQTPPTSSGGCNCAACLAKRENAVPPEVERDAHITQTYWMEIRHIVRCIYRDNMSLANQSSRATIGSDKMRMIVRKLCSRDPHQFFQRLETLAREYLLEVKVRLLEQLSCGFNSPQLAIEFIQMLLDEYSTLCNALPSLLYLLEPLEESEYVQRLGVTVELMNKNIFRELIFAESFMSSNLPLIIAQLRLASLASDPYHRNMADALSQRYVALDQEMEDICRVWKSAKDQLNTHQHRQQERRQHLERIRADGEALKQMKQQAVAKAKESQSKPTAKDPGKSHSPEHSPNHRHHPTSTFPLAVPTSLPSIPSPAQLHKSLVGDQDEEKSSQVAEWSRLLFKCIKPVGEPEFRLNGDIATHTITLRLDMTELDLAGAQATCTRDDLKRYRKLGLTLEEIVEVSMKLNALKGLGINLKIEDLFDEEGFSLADVNDTLVGEEAVQDDVYFLEDKPDVTEEREEPRGGEGLSQEDWVDLHRARELILLRQESSNGRSRQNDFLQGMRMKIRFMKRLTVEDLERNFVADGGKVIFNSCDQVQMKLTQLELNSVRLVTSADCIGSDLGLSQEGGHAPTMRGLETGDKSREDYAFIQTDSHKEFMDLLLEKRKALETAVSSKQREKRAAEEALRKEGAAKESAEKSDKTPPTSHASPISSKSSLASMTRLPDPAPLDPPGFKPVYLPNSSQPCQCSTCVGAMAAFVTGEQPRPLNPTDPLATTVTIESTLKPSQLHPSSSDVRPHQEERHKATGDKLVTGKKSMTTTSPISKEGVWQNWMSAGHMETEAQLQNGTLTPHPHHHHHHHHAHHYHGDGVDGADSGYSDSLKSSCSLACDCHNHGNGTPSTSGYGTPYSSSHTPTGTSSPNYCTTPTGTCGAGEVGSNGARRYCPCCYCELFGHNGPPTAPTSHNFTKQRDKMRLKLEEKKKKRESDLSKGSQLGASDSRPVEELLAFIEGPEEQQSSGRGNKKPRKKKAAKGFAPDDDSEAPVATNVHSTSSHTHPTQNGDIPVDRKEQRPVKSRDQQRGSVKREEAQVSAGQRDQGGADRGRGDIRQSPRAPRQKGGARISRRVAEQSSQDEQTPTDGPVVAPEEEYDDELEAFKKFCFEPVKKDKKIAVVLNMQDLMSKIK